MNKKVVYWDSNIFLMLFNEDGSSNEWQDCKAVWVDAQKGGTFIATSTLTIAEVIYAKGTPKMDLSKRPFMTNFFRQECISLKSLTRDVAEIARDIVWDLNIKAKDAVHVATCAFCKIGEMHSFDKDLLNKNKISIKDFDIEVRKPYGPQELPFKDQKELF